MHIIHLDLGKEMRGGQRQVLYLADQQQKEGRHDVTVACPANSLLARELRNRNVSVLELPSRWDYDFRNLIRILCFVRKKGQIVLHTHEPRAVSLGTVTCLGRKKKMRLVHSRRVSYRPGRFSAARYKMAQRVVCVSREIGQVMFDAGLPKTKVAVIHSAIELERFRPEKYSHEDDRLRIGVVGAFTAQKGHFSFLRALQKLNQRADFQFRAVLAGTGPLEDELKALAAELGLAKLVRFAGYVDSARLLPEIDLLIVPSVDGEGSSATVKEGWASGTGVIASDLESNRELVSHDENGLIFRAGSATALSIAIENYVHNPDKALAMRLAGAARVEDFSVLNMTRAYESVYAECWDAKVAG